MCSGEASKTRILFTENLKNPGRDRNILLMISRQITDPWLDITVVQEYDKNIWLGLARAGLELIRTLRHAFWLTVCLINALIGQVRELAWVALVNPVLTGGTFYLSPRYSQVPFRGWISLISLSPFLYQLRNPLLLPQRIYTIANDRRNEEEMENVDRMTERNGVPRENSLHP